MKKNLLSVAAALVIAMQSFSAICVSAATTTDIAVFSYTSSGTIGDDIAKIAGGSYTDGYPATSGTEKSTSKLFASVDGTSEHVIEWSKAEYAYNGSTTAKVPIMAASTSKAWGSAPYFLIECPTKGYSALTFTASVSGTKKSPADYKLQYSTDGSTYTDVKTAAAITKNKNLTGTALFSAVTLPAGAEMADTLYLKIIAVDNKTIGGATYPGTTGGEAAINAIKISGTATSTPTLSAPTANIANGSDVLSDAKITFSTDADSASILYSVDGGTEQTYTGAVTPFLNNTNQQVTIKARATAAGYTDSPESTYIYTCTKDDLESFNITNINDVHYINGAAAATAGVYPCGTISASADGKNKFVPLYNEDKGASLVIAPDDTLTWENGGYWQIETATAGYDNAYISLNAFSSKKGPYSATLSYSTDGVNFTTMEQDKQLQADNTTLFLDSYPLPSAAANKQKVYIRLTFDQDKRFDTSDSSALFANESKGNTYINNIVISGKRNSNVKMPVSDSKTNFFAAEEKITYTSYDNAEMKYNVYDQYGDEIVTNALYDSAAGISPASLPGFGKNSDHKFRIDIWAESGSEKSVVNSTTYEYKGDAISEFKASSTLVFADTITSADGKLTISMYPNGTDKTVLSYSDKYDSLYASSSTDNAWNFDTTRANPDNDGYWIIKTSTKGYKDIKFSANQISTDKGPRDFALSCSSDGITYTAIKDSQIKAAGASESSYKDFALPTDMDNCSTVYLKVKIDGGETETAVELSDATVAGKGNTGIDAVGIYGTPIENEISADIAGATAEKGKTYNYHYASITGSAETIAAVYDSKGILIKCVLGGQNITIPNFTGTGKVKFMLIDDFGKMMPLTKPLAKDVE